MERREAPRSGRGSVRPALRSANLRAEFPGPKVFEGSGGPGTRGPVRGARRLPALHRGTHCRRPHLAPSPGVAIDDALNEQGKNPDTRESQKRKRLLRDRPTLTQRDSSGFNAARLIRL